MLDIQAVADIAHGIGAPLMVDNTFATPYLCRPIEFGADIVVHSATKFIGGHGTSIGGVVVEAGTFDWSNGRFPVVADPSPAYHGLAFHETFGMYGYLMKLRAESLRDLGACHEPVQRVPVPARAGDAAAAHGAPRRERAGRGPLSPAASGGRAVRYAGLADSPYRPLVERYLPRGAGAVFAFDLTGGREAGQRFIESLRLWSHLANVGDAKSLVIHPASTTHRQLSDEELVAAGISGGTIRLSVGSRRWTTCSGIWSAAWQRRQRVAETERRPLRSASRNARSGARSGGGGMTTPRSYRQRPTSAVSGSSASSARSCTPRGPSPSSACRPTCCGRATSSASTCSATATASFRSIPSERGSPGREGYATLSDIPFHVDVVDVFRAPAFVPAIAEEAVRIGARRALAAVRRDQPRGRRDRRARRPEGRRWTAA